MSSAPGIATARKQVGMTQFQLAIAVGVQPVTVARWECGTRDPSSETLVRLAEVLGVTVDALLRPEFPSPLDGAVESQEGGRVA